MMHGSHPWNAAVPDTLLSHVLLPFANILILLGVGLALHWQDFRAIAREPRPVAVGLVAHYLCLPILGFAMAWMFRDTPAIAIGFVLVAACPSASVSNLLSYLGRGNAALAVTLTVISSLATLASVPLLVDVAAQWLGGRALGLRLPFGDTAVRLGLLVLLPLTIGMGLRAFAPALARRLRPWLQRLGLALLIAVVVVYVVQNNALFADSLRRIGPAVAMMGLGALATGLALGVATRLSRPDTLTLGMETGVQNCMLALLVALTMMHSPEAAMPAIVYGVLMFAPAFALVWLGRRFLPRPRSVDNDGV